MNSTQECWQPSHWNHTNSKHDLTQSLTVQVLKKQAEKELADQRQSQELTSLILILQL